MALPRYNEWFPNIHSSRCIYPNYTTRSSGGTTTKAAFFIQFQVDMLIKCSCHGRNCTTPGDHQVGNWHFKCQHSIYYYWSA